MDAVHAAPHRRYDIGLLARAGVDFLACSPYKFYGPQVFVSHGDFYAATVAERYRVRAGGGFARAGAACYTTGEEVERLVATVGRAAA